MDERTYGGMSAADLRRSMELQERALEEIPEATSSNYRGSESYSPYPLIYIDRGDGARVTDVDGNEYLDFHGGVSSTILGHNVPEQTEAVKAQLERGSYFATAHETEYEAARLVNELVPASDMTKFLSTGTEAVTSAIRLARAYTGKEKVLKFEGMYHGHTDYMMVNVHPHTADLNGRHAPTKVPEAPGVTEAAMGTVETVPWNDPTLLEERLERHGDEIAAVITEAVMGNSGLIRPNEGYLEEIRRLTEAHDVVFILDEVITGFRMGLKGAQGYFDIQPDLAIYGKALANGYPCAAITGKREIMETIGSAPEKAKVSGTFSGNPVATAATKANLEILTEIGEGGYEEFYDTGKRLTEGLRAVFEDAGEDVFIPEFAGFFYVHFTDGDAEPERWSEWRDLSGATDTERYKSFAAEMVGRGIFLPPKHGRINLMHAHTDEHVEAFLDAAVDAVEQLD